jgi:hypothetical protein
VLARQLDEQPHLINIRDEVSWFALAENHGGFGNKTVIQKFSNNSFTRTNPLNH